MLPIWFFIGCLLAIYGVLILVEGVRGYAHPPASIVLSELHLQLWWGGVLLILGLFWMLRFRPGQTK